MKKKRLLTDRSGNLEEQIMQQISERISNDIDAGIMRELYRDMGWHEVVLGWVMTHETGQEVDAWVEQKSKGEYWNRGLCWMFENEADAMWFKMRWMA